MTSFARSARQHGTISTFIEASSRRSNAPWTCSPPLHHFVLGTYAASQKENLYIQFCKITDPAKSGKKANLTTNYIVEEIPWPDAVRRQLRDVHARLTSFRALIEPARSKRVAHMDLPAQIEQWDNLGRFPRGAEVKFLQDLQTFIDIAYGHLHNGSCRPIVVAMSTDTHLLVRALEKSIVFDQCTKCTSGERAVAVLDYEDRSA